MEIEAKFSVPNRQTYRSLLRLRDTAGYVLIPTSAVQMADRYFDTADGRLLAAGYACRLRTENASVLATLKGLGGAQGAIHHRDEQEIQLAAWTPDATAWPASPARDLALKLSGGAPLQPSTPGPAAGWTAEPASRRAGHQAGEGPGAAPDRPAP